MAAYDALNASAAQPVASHDMTTADNSIARREDTVDQPTSAEQPVASRDITTADSFNVVCQRQVERGTICSLLQIVTLDDCKSWCDCWAGAGAPAKRISEIIAVLQEPPSRKRRSLLQDICKRWGVGQKLIQKKRKLCDIESDLEEMIVQETKRLRKLHAQHGHFSGIFAVMQSAEREGSSPASSNDRAIMQG